jgi:hypothetical protein
MVMQEPLLTGMSAGLTATGSLVDVQTALAARARSRSRITPFSSTDAFGNLRHKKYQIINRQACPARKIRRAPQLHLASDDARSVTGQGIGVTGGD